MERWINGVRVHYVEHGAGIPLVALPGAGVDHREIEAALEAIGPGREYRRIYPDLPGMGASTAEGLASNADVVTLLGAFVEQVAGGPVYLLGHSYGAYLARGVAARRPDLLRGLALVCPLAERTGEVPDQRALPEQPGTDDELGPGLRAGFDEYFVRRTPATARRYREHIAPGTATVDQAAVARICAEWAIDLDPGSFAGPTVIVAGRCDGIVGYADATALLECYPRASLAVLDDAGHALMHECPDVLAALLADWLGRA